MRYYRKSRNVDYTDEQLQALATELAESKRLYEKEKDYEDSCNKRRAGLLQGREETLVESNVVKSVRVP